ncbi:Extracellular calcium-sensing receptor [Liparis tanakae]|uniref:Extracellular calcium-sensing receptor n=1 Tax=Liparis tanakae TaxID=230148 RepID=A0A4Z2EF80_9TELE|nr:Extracellular calcium-sensing receptor [Liparis tanakae]
MATFITAASQEGICVEYSEAISRTDPSWQVAKVVRVIQSGSARVLVAFLAQGEMDILLEEALKQNLTGLQWVVKHLQVVNFTLLSGERVHFDGNGDPAAMYELVNWQRNQAGDPVFVAIRENAHTVHWSTGQMKIIVSVFQR